MGSSITGADCLPAFFTGRVPLCQHPYYSSPFIPIGITNNKQIKILLLGADDTNIRLLVPGKRGETDERVMCGEGVLSTDPLTLDMY